MSDSQKYGSKLHGKRVLIIGGTSGIGYATAEASLEQGATVILSSSNPTRIEDALSRLTSSYPSKKSQAAGFQCDLGDDNTLEANLERLFKSATDNGSKKLDHIIFTAADPLAIVPLSDISMEKIRAAGTVRFCVPLLVGKYALTYVNKSRESSVTITTGAVFQHPMKDWPIIAGYAAGIVGISRSLAIELAPVRANTVSPGAVDTEMWKMSEEQKQNMFKSIESNLLTGKVANASDIAESYLYLMRDSNVTGTVISTNGGHIIT